MTKARFQAAKTLDPVANLRDFDWNFWKLWNSPAMDARRQHARSSCHCTHESNCYYPSLAFSQGIWCKSKSWSSN
ncbi:MAG: hypothetical protein U0Y68_06255 [Blastocatellia bacterium]